MIIKKNDKQSTYKSTKFGLERVFVFSRMKFLVALLVCVIVSAYWSSKVVKTKGYSGLWDFVSTVSSNYFSGLKGNPEVISIIIKEDDYKKLEKNRKQALERGVIINDMDGDYVAATIEYNGKKIDVKLRLKGHMTDHLQADKWSFRVKTKGSDSFMGMKRFSIQHPGTRGYIYEWIYHELMKREDVIALRYKFINVNVNGENWGIYAVEENFENELIENNSRKKGPILRFNPDLYWINRYNMMKKESSSDEYASYYSANPEAYRENKVLEDSRQSEYYLKAIALIEGLRNKKVSVEQAFDIPRLAKFHAIIDLVGGEHSIDWSDIKYYYNPVAGQFEPVAYESFTNLSSRNLSSFYKYVIIDSLTNYVDWHSMIFSNPTFFAEYVKQLERVTHSSYLDSFFNESNEALNENLAIIYKEFPYKKFDKQHYYKRQAIIKKLISPPKAIHAYFNIRNADTIDIHVGAIDALPVVIKSISINGTFSLGKENTILAAKQINTYVNFSSIKFVMSKNFKWSEKSSDSIKIQYSILGASELKEANVFPFPHTDNEFITDDLKNKESTIHVFPFLEIDEIKKVIIVKPGVQIIFKDLIVPRGYKLIAGHGVALDLKNNAEIISYSPVVFEGTVDEPIQITSSDSTSQGIVFIGAPLSKFSNVVFKNMPKVNDKQWERSGYLTFYESPVEFKNCSFYNSKAEDAINLIRSHFVFVECLFHKMLDDALDIDFSEGTIESCAFEKCKENALDIAKSNVRVVSLFIDGAGNKAINVKAGTYFSGSDIRISNSKIAISSEDESTVELKQVAISNSEIGVVAYKNKPDGGHAVIKLAGLVLNNVKKSCLREKKSTILIDGAEVIDEVKDVESIIKNDKKTHK